HRRGIRARARVRRDRAQGGCPPAGHRACGGGRRIGGSRARRCPTDDRPGRSRGRRTSVILVVDNYDSFTFNLVQALEAAGAVVRVYRNDAIDKSGLEALADDPETDLRGIVISPGPGTPESAGVSIGAIEVAAARRIPL